jgi:Patatin-like phospholipase
MITPAPCRLDRHPDNLAHWNANPVPHLAMPGKELQLLCLDGGGVRGLSSLQVLKQLMQTINPLSPPKPCDYFDMIGGTSTGGQVFLSEAEL